MSPVTKEDVRHAEGWNGDDHTLCGLAYDAFESGDISERVILAAPRSMVTCEDCKRLIAHCQDRFTANYRVRHERK